MMKKFAIAGSVFAAGLAFNTYAAPKIAEKLGNIRTKYQCAKEAHKLANEIGKKAHMSRKDIRQFESQLYQFFVLSTKVDEATRAKAAEILMAS